MHTSYSCGVYDSCRSVAMAIGYTTMCAYVCAYVCECVCVHLCVCVV